MTSHVITTLLFNDDIIDKKTKTNDKQKLI